jgi:REP element-mobilizing transposase RayT
MMKDDPIGFFLTWVTYGTWLPGDSRGWVEYHHGWQLPDPIRQREATAKMNEDACVLTQAQRAAVETQIEVTCRYRNWSLLAANCRSNHVHVVVKAANTPPKKIRVDLKAWATRCLKEQFDSSRENWWAERGSIRFIYNDEGLEASVMYVTEGQDRHRS